MLSDQALVAAKHVGDHEPDSEEGLFYARKADNLRFYVHQVLPRTAGLKAAITSDDRSVFNAQL